MDKQSGETKSIDDAISEAIDEVLTAIGASAKNMVYLYLNRELKIRKEDIPCRLEEFMGALQRIFGCGARVLELRFMKEVEIKMDVTYPFPIQGSTLQECRAYIRQQQAKVEQKVLL
ncbi:MAG: hypothetical protein ACQCN6_12560 [Candidatus Bathyarchaeia archaeon]|jgi:hypothetical protein